MHGRWAWHGGDHGSAGISKTAVWRWTFHFTPTSAIWINAVEGFFAVLTKRPLKRGAFKSVVDLRAAINRFVAEHNQHPKPLVWTADPHKITAAANRGHQTLESIH